jgi:hypothetical protein
MAEELSGWQEYVPRYAEHVKGRYTRVTVEDGRRQPQLVEARCERCGAWYRNECRQGRPRQHVALFARQHLHPAGLQDKRANLPVPR